MKKPPYPNFITSAITKKLNNQLLSEIYKGAMKPSPWIEILGKASPERAKANLKIAEKYEKKREAEKKAYEKYTKKLADRWFKGKPKHRGAYQVWDTMLLQRPAYWNGKHWEVTFDEEYECPGVVSDWRPIKKP